MVRACLSCVPVVRACRARLSCVFSAWGCACSVPRRLFSIWVAKYAPAWAWQGVGGYIMRPLAETIHLPTLLRFGCIYRSISCTWNDHAACMLCCARPLLIQTTCPHSSTHAGQDCRGTRASHCEANVPADAPDEGGLCWHVRCRR